jgi:DNA-directed RNA polymerase delta subunit
MSCNPTYKGIRYNSIEELKIANKFNRVNFEETIAEFKEFVGKSNTQYQKNQTNSIAGIVASEKTIRDLAARLSDRIGIPIRFESDRTKDYKGKIENGVAYINLAYATLDTSLHEIIFHPMIRALKLKSEQTEEQYINDMIEKGIIKKEC